MESDEGEEMGPGEGEEVGSEEGGEMSSDEGEEMVSNQREEINSSVISVLVQKSDSEAISSVQVKIYEKEINKLSVKLKKEIQRENEELKLKVRFYETQKYEFESMKRMNEELSAKIKENVKQESTKEERKV